MIAFEFKVYTNKFKEKREPKTISWHFTNKSIAGTRFFFIPNKLTISKNKTLPNGAKFVMNKRHFMNNFGRSTFEFPTTWLRIAEWGAKIGALVNNLRSALLALSYCQCSFELVLEHISVCFRVRQKITTQLIIKYKGSAQHLP